MYEKYIFVYERVCEGKRECVCMHVCAHMCGGMDMYIWKWIIVQMTEFLHVDE
jgi:hypothetical protein